jgi:aldehyde dehydrogenase (NAD+)
MTTPTGFYINGAWVSPQGRNTLPVVNPATEQAIGKVQCGNATDVDLAVAAARAAFPAFAETPLADRIALLERIVDLYKSRFDDIGKAISDEMGAPLIFATRFQTGAGLSHFKEILRILKSFEFEEQRGTTRVFREPIGVAGMIVPWNWPMNQITCKVAPALAAGCTMILKPSEMAPTAVAILTDILHEAGVPAGVFNLVSGEGYRCVVVYRLDPGRDRRGDGRSADRETCGPRIGWQVRKYFVG